MSKARPTKKEKAQFLGLEQALVWINPKKASCTQPRGSQGQFSLRHPVPTTHEELGERLWTIAEKLGKDYGLLRSRIQIRNALEEIQTWAELTKNCLDSFSPLLLRLVLDASGDPIRESRNLEALFTLVGWFQDRANRAVQSVPAPSGMKEKALTLTPTQREALERGALSGAIEQAWLLWNWWVGSPTVVPVESREDADIAPTSFEGFLVALLQFAGTLTTLKLPASLITVRRHAIPVVEYFDRLEPHAAQKEWVQEVRSQFFS